MTGTSRMEGEPVPAGSSSLFGEALRLGEALGWVCLPCYLIDDRWQPTVKYLHLMDEPYDLALLEKLWDGHEDAPGIAALWPQDVVAAEADSEEGEAWLVARKFPRTLTFASRRGPHYLFRGSGEGLDDAPAAGVEVLSRASGKRLMVLPPTAGKVWFPSLSPYEVELMSLPASLNGKKARKATTRVRITEESIPDGRRTAEMTRIVGSFVATLPPALALTAAITYDGEHCKPPLGQERIRRMVEDFASRDSVTKTWEEMGDKDPAPRQVPEPRSDWQPVDLAPLLRGEVLDPPPSILQRSDDVALFYLGKTNALSGEPEAAKGWVALAGCKEQMDLGEFCLYLDFEDAAPGVVERLRALGATDKQIEHQFVYVRPDTAATVETVSNLPGIGTSLIVVDGITEAMSSQGLNLNDNKDVASFVHLLPRPLSKMGGAVVLIDHVTKDRNGRGLGPIGAQHKLAGIDGASYAVEMIRPFGRGMSGMSRLKVEKDRPGYVRPRSLFAKVAGDVFLESAEDGAVQVRIEPAEGTEDGDGGFRPTYYMEKVSRYLELAGEQTVSAIATSVEGKREWVIKAAHQLVTDGYVARRDGPRNAVLLSFTKAYRQADDA